MGTERRALSARRESSAREGSMLWGGGGWGWSEREWEWEWLGLMAVTRGEGGCLLGLQIVMIYGSLAE